MVRVENVLLTKEEFKAFQTVQKILNDLGFSNWANDAKFVSEVATGVEDIEIPTDNGGTRFRSFKVRHQ